MKVKLENLKPEQIREGMVIDASTDISRRDEVVIEVNADRVVFLFKSDFIVSLFHRLILDGKLAGRTFTDKYYKGSKKYEELSKRYEEIIQGESR